LSGDVLFAGSVGRTDLPGGDGATMARTLRDVVARLDPAWDVLPGHGPATTVARELATNPFLAGRGASVGRDDAAGVARVWEDPPHGQAHTSLRFPRMAPRRSDRRAARPRHPTFGVRAARVRRDRDARGRAARQAPAQGRHDQRGERPAKPA